ncbi:MAG: ABC transporter substrate-binding protein [Microcoleaceae cyanobacterium]
MLINRRNFLQQSGGFGVYLALDQLGLKSAPVTPTQSALKLTLQLDWKFNVQFAGVLLADYYGLYDQQRLEVEIQPWQPGVDLTERVATDPLVVSCAEQDVILAAQAAGRPIRAIATMFQHSPLGLMSLPEHQIISLYDLVGKRVGVHQDSQKVMDLVMGFSQLSPNQIEVVEISYGEKYDKLLTGAIDAVQCYAVDEPIGFVIRTGIQPNVLNLSDYGYDAYVQTLFVHPSLLSQYPQAVHNFLQATFNGWELALSDIPKAAEIVVEHYASPRGKYSDLEYQVESLHLVADYILPEVDSVKIGQILPERWQTMSERLARYHLIETIPSLVDSVDLTLWRSQLNSASTTPGMA